MSRFWGAVFSSTIVVLAMLTTGQPASAAIPDRRVQSGEVRSTMDNGIFAGQIELVVTSPKSLTEVDYQDGNLLAGDPPTNKPCLSISYTEDGSSEVRNATHVGLSYVQASGTYGGTMRINFIGPSSRNYTLYFQLLCDLTLQVELVDGETFSNSAMTVKSSEKYTFNDERISTTRLGLRVHKLKSDMRYNPKVGPPITFSWSNPTVVAWMFSDYWEDLSGQQMSVAEAAVPELSTVRHGTAPWGTLNARPSWSPSFMGAISTRGKVLLIPRTDRYRIRKPAVLEVRNGKWYSITLPESNDPVLFQNLPIESPPPPPKLTWSYKSGVLKLSLKNITGSPACPIKGYIFRDEGGTLEKTKNEKLYDGDLSEISYNVKKNLLVNISIQSWNEIGLSEITRLSFRAK